MKTFLALNCVILLACLSQVRSATIPAGTIITLRTLQSVASIDQPGTQVPFALAYPVVVNGKVALPAGTYFSGRVITSRRMTMSPDVLTVNINAGRIAGREVPVVTTGPQHLTDNYKTPDGAELSFGWDNVATGTRIQFQLARPIVF